MALDGKNFPSLNHLKGAISLLIGSDNLSFGGARIRCSTPAHLLLPRRSPELALLLQVLALL